MAKVFAVSGLKNSGKTTLIGRLVAYFGERGLRAAVIKHDGHDFEPDVPGTDSWKHRQAGACGTAVFSANRFMLVRDRADTTAEEMIACFPNADLIILEGCKHSSYPKVVMLREGDAREGVCDLATVWAFVISREMKRAPAFAQIPVFYRDEVEKLGDFLLKKLKGDG